MANPSATQQSVFVADIFVPLPCHDGGDWAVVEQAFSAERGPIDTVECLRQRMQEFLPWQRYNRRSGRMQANPVDLSGLDAVLRESGDIQFFEAVLPFMIDCALRLRQDFGPGSGCPLRFLQQSQTGALKVPRAKLPSLLANMFFCTFELTCMESMDGFERGAGMVPEVCAQCLDRFSTRRLLSVPAGSSPQEHAKLRMIVHYFERLSAAAAPPLGFLHIHRVHTLMTHQAPWASSARPLLPMELMPERIGFEDPAAPGGLMHADFANMYIGGGALSGGCVQEEIRFSICPEALLSILVCPVMQEHEAVQIVGAEQFSAYCGYGFSLRYAGDYVDPSPLADGGQGAGAGAGAGGGAGAGAGAAAALAPTAAGNAEDAGETGEAARSKAHPPSLLCDTPLCDATLGNGTPLTAIAAIDALDGRDRRLRPFGLLQQLSHRFRLRELGKAAAGFRCASTAMAAAFPAVATGNWGCGVFKGHAELKAVLQWMAASQGGTRLTYFPFDEAFGPRMAAATARLVGRGATVGGMWAALDRVEQQEQRRPCGRDEFFARLEEAVGAGDAGDAEDGGCGGGAQCVVE
jgi:poly(ADP-ribose) glycohydrolase